MRRLRSRAYLSAALLLLVGACAPDFTPAWEVAEPGLLASRVEIEGDTTGRSRPKLGEKFSVLQSIMLPGKSKAPLTKRFDGVLELCLGIKLSNGTLACANAEDLGGIPSALVLSQDPEAVSEHEMRFSGLAVPNFITQLPAPFDDIDRLVLFGAVCVEGDVERIEGKQVGEDPFTELYRCTNNAAADYADPLVFNFSVLLDLGRPGDENFHPSFACEAPEGADDACRAGVEVEGEDQVPGSIVLVKPKGGGESTRAEAWPSSPLAPTEEPPWTGCDRDDFWGPRVRAGDDEHTIRVRFDRLDRETYSYEVMRYNETVSVTDREELLVSHSITNEGGELDRLFSVLARTLDDDAAEIEVGYKPPDQPGEKAEPEQRIPDDGRLVRFYFSVRDQRGGVDTTTRELCLLPELPKGP
jgi:hypothetical protein